MLEYLSVNLEIYLKILLFFSNIYLKIYVKIYLKILFKLVEMMLIIVYIFIILEYYHIDFENSYFPNTFIYYLDMPFESCLQRSQMKNFWLQINEFALLYRVINMIRVVP